LVFDICSLKFLEKYFASGAYIENIVILISKVHDTISVISALIRLKKIKAIKHFGIALNFRKRKYP